MPAKAAGQEEARLRLLEELAGRLEAEPTPSPAALLSHIKQCMAKRRVHNSYGRNMGTIMLVYCAVVHYVVLYCTLSSNLRGKPRPTKASRSMLLTMMTIIITKNRHKVGGGDIG